MLQKQLQKQPIIPPAPACSIFAHCTSFCLDNSGNPGWHRIRKVFDALELQSLLLRRYPFPKLIRSVGVALVAINPLLEHRPDVLDRVKIRAVGWPLDDWNIQYCKLFPSPIMGRCTVLHEHGIVA